MNKLMIIAVAVSLLAIQFALAESAIAGGGVRPNEFGRPGKRAPTQKKAKEKKNPAQETTTKETTTEKQRLDRGDKFKGGNHLEGGGVRRHNAG